MMHAPGAGVGGHCLPKDPWLLHYGLEKYGAFKFAPNLIIESRRINDHMPQHMKKLVEEALRDKGVKLRDARVCILGLAFLEDSDDPRHTPALPLYNLLKSECKEVVVHDPNISAFEGVALTNNLEDALRDRNCVVIVTRHKEYLNISLGWLKDILATPVIVDGRNVFDVEECIKAGFSFRGVGVGQRETMQSIRRERFSKRLRDS